MKFYLLSDNTDTLLGLRLAGIDGRVVHEAAELESAIEEVRGDEGIGILLLTQKLAGLCPHTIESLKRNSRRPMLVEIPDRHGGDIAASLETYIREAIGINLD